MVLEKKILKVVTIDGHGGHLGHVTWNIYTNFRFPFPRRLHMKFGYDWPSGFGGMVVIYMYIAPGQGKTTPWIIFFFH